MTFYDLALLNSTNFFGDTRKQDIEKALLKLGFVNNEYRGCDNGKNYTIRATIKDDSICANVYFDFETDGDTY